MAVETLPLLTEDTYYEDKAYLSNSRFKSYVSCAFRQYAIDCGFWPAARDTESFLVGNYVHSYFESDEAHQRFIDTNHDLVIASKGKTAGKPKAAFLTADRMIQSLESETLFEEYYHGLPGEVVEKEVILTGDLFGLPFKCKVDSLNLSRNYFIDLKTMSSLQKEVYSPSLRTYTKSIIYNVLEYGYHVQFYIYQQLLLQNYGQLFTPYMVAVSKEPVPDKELVLMTDTILGAGRDYLLAHIEQVADAVSGKKLPNCGKCDFCLTHKSITRPISIDELFAT